MTKKRRQAVLPILDEDPERLNPLEVMGGGRVEPSASSDGADHEACRGPGERQDRGPRNLLTKVIT